MTQQDSTLEVTEQDSTLQITEQDSTREMTQQDSTFEATEKFCVKHTFTEVISAGTDARPHPRASSAPPAVLEGALDATEQVGFYKQSLQEENARTSDWTKQL